MRRFFRRAGEIISSVLTRSRVDNVIYVWLAVPAILAVVFGLGWVVSLIWRGDENRWSRGFWELFIERYLLTDGINILNAPAWFWAICTILAAISIGVWMEMRDSIKRKPSDVIGVVTLTLVMLFSGTWTVVGLWEDDKDAGRFYNQATTFVVSDIDNPPASLKKLIEGTRAPKNENDGCLRVGGSGESGVHDVPSCVTEGEMPTDWEQRISSASGAQYAMSRSSGAAANTYLMFDTLTYVYGDEANEGSWTALRDGKNKQSLYGIVTWSSGNTIGGCEFEGEYAINKAFDGGWSNNLRDLLADEHPNLLYDDRDIWGYCDGEEPIVVIPVVRQVSHEQRTGMLPAGVLVIRGSASGDPNIQYDREVSAGELPGPVYPTTMVEKQRGHIEWAAGRDNRWRAKFGFEPADSDAQMGNNAEFLLRRQVEVDGEKVWRLFWVSPLTPRSSDSQQFVAYAVSPADEVRDGRMGEMRVYVLDQGDPRIVNLDDLEARLRDHVSIVNPGYFSAGGSIVEFNPMNETTWVAFGELKGRVKYRFTISTDATVVPTIVDLDTGQTITQPGSNQPVEPGTGETNAACGKKPSDMSQTELINCLRQFADELDGRQQQPTPAPTPTS